MNEKQHIWLLYRELHNKDNDDYSELLGVSFLGYFPGTETGKTQGMKTLREVADAWAARFGMIEHVKCHDGGNEIRMWVDDQIASNLKRNDHLVFVLRRVMKTGYKHF